MPTNRGRIVLLDATSDSLTVCWPKVAGASSYTLQYQSGSRNSNDIVGDNYVTLSDRLAATRVKKKHLDGGPFFFRVRANHEDANDSSSSTFTSTSKWCDHEGEPFYTLSPHQERIRPKAPTVLAAEGNYSLRIEWVSSITTESASSAKNDYEYELQMREDVEGHADAWETIASGLRSMVVRKKNLNGQTPYQFRVRIQLKQQQKQQQPSGSEEGFKESPFSPPSASVVPLPLSAGMETLFSQLPHQRLLQGQGRSVSYHDALPGKVVLLYASAHWCGPCRQFTPQLVRFYETHRDQVEVIFLSCDRDEAAFRSYFATMPWTAVPFHAEGGGNVSVREELLGRIQVTGIPRLVVLNSATGGILVNNAVGQPMDVTSWKKGQTM